MSDEPSSGDPGAGGRADRGRGRFERATRQQLAQERRWAMRARRGRMDLRRGPPWAGGWSGAEQPPWWPEGEPWPPIRRRPWRGFGCLFGFLFVAGVLGLLSLGTAVVGDILRAPGFGGVVVRIASLLVLIAILAGLARGARAIRGTGSVLDELVEQAARVEAGDYRARVEPPHPVPEPVRQLTRGFNTMAARLEADETQRRTLLADVTHELRTPLAVIQGSVEAILDGIHPADEAHLAAILEETRVLDRLIEDLRTLALSESGGLSLHREPTDLGVLVTEVATSFAATAGAAGVTVEPAVDDDVPLLDVDPVRIREVIGNLVANAVRHTPSGGRVTIGARRSAPSSVEIVVRDTGSGIPADLLPHVFDRFARAATSTGSGLGLSIARGLVELHGGTIAAASPTGGGAEIRIVLPIDAGSA
jgi:two-component system sensor histidine kinase BaeS